MIHQADKIIQDMTTEASPVPPIQYMVKWRGYPIHFHTNVSQGRCYEVCREEEATHFDTITEAYARASRHGLIWDEHTLCVPSVPSVPSDDFMHTP